MSLNTDEITPSVADTELLMQMEKEVEERVVRIVASWLKADGISQSAGDPDSTELRWQLLESFPRDFDFRFSLVQELRADSSFKNLILEIVREAMSKEF